MSRYAAALESPVGPLVVVTNDDGALTHLHFEVDPASSRVARGAQWDAERCAAAVSQLKEYFARKRREFDLPLAPQGTQFQQDVWAELVRIPYGATVSYGELARRLGLPLGASRAVGAANGANPIAIVVPCHRVIGSNGKLTGYAYGLDMKRRLLELEGAIAPTLL